MSNNNNKNGPEWAPLRKYIESFKIVVEIFDKDDKLIRTERLDYGLSDDRMWLGKLSFWAWSNGHSVETREDK